MKNKFIIGIVLTALTLIAARYAWQQHQTLRNTRAPAPVCKSIP